MSSKLLKASLAGAAAVALAVGGGTYAAWSDYQEITGNTAGAGHLTLNLSHNNTQGLKFDHVKMAPGGEGRQRIVYVASNDGESVPNGRLYLTVQGLSGSENGCDGNGERAADPSCDVAGNPAEFAQQAKLLVQSYLPQSDGSCTKQYAESDKTVSTSRHSLDWYVGNRIELTGSHNATLRELAPGQGLCVAMAIRLPGDATNASQGDSASFTTRFDLEQSEFGG